MAKRPLMVASKEEALHQAQWAKRALAAARLKEGPAQKEMQAMTWPLVALKTLSSSLSESLS